MNRRRQYIIDMIATMSGNKEAAEMIVNRLIDEGLLVLGYGEPDIDRVVEKFKSAFGTTKTSKYDRFAVSRLVKTYGANSICGIIDLLAQHNGVKYAPVVNNLTELENKIPSILSFLRKQKGDETLDV